MDTLYSHESVSYPRKRQGGGRLALSRKVCSWFHFHFHSSRETDELRAVGNAKYGSSSPARHPRHSCRSGRGCERLLRAEEVRSPTPLVMERLANIRGGHVSWPSPPRSLLTRMQYIPLARSRGQRIWFLCLAYSRSRSKSVLVACQIPWQRTTRMQTGTENQ